MSLKALAHMINERDSQRDTCGTAVVPTVPSRSDGVGQPEHANEATPSTPPTVGPKVIDAMRRGREAALKEGIDVTAAEPEWLRTSKLVPDSRTIRIPDAVRMKIEAIESEARCLGWPPELLWNAEFWRQPRGLAAVLDEGDEIGEVTADYIAILKVKRDLLRFQRRHS